VKPGDCFMSDSGEGFLVFGEVLEGYPEGRLQHYRFCRCYSVACPEGELGDVHVSTIRCIVFDVACCAGRCQGQCLWNRRLAAHSQTAATERRGDRPWQSAG